MVLCPEEKIRLMPASFDFLEVKSKDKEVGGREVYFLKEDGIDFLEYGRILRRNNVA